MTLTQPAVAYQFPETLSGALEPSGDLVVEADWLGSRYPSVVFGSPQVNLYVHDADVAARFYRESFGFTETFRTPEHGRPDHVELRLGEFTLGLGTFDTLREAHGVSAGSGPPRAEVVLWTDDVDRAYADLAARNVRTLSAPHDFLSLRAAWVADPDGNPVQIVMRQQHA